MPRRVANSSPRPAAVVTASAKALVAAGPELNGIIGRPAGTTADYQYSDAMKNSGVVWTRDKLAAYIEAPKKVVSGTRMIFWGISDPEKIDNILAYLETFQPK
jgi:cytochrome c